MKTKREVTDKYMANVKKEFPQGLGTFKEGYIRALLWVLSNDVKCEFDFIKSNSKIKSDVTELIFDREFEDECPKMKKYLNIVIPKALDMAFDMISKEKRKCDLCNDDAVYNAKVSIDNIFSRAYLCEDCYTLYGISD